MYAACFGCQAHSMQSLTLACIQVGRSHWNSHGFFHCKFVMISSPIRKKNCEGGLQYIMDGIIVWRLSHKSHKSFPQKEKKKTKHGWHDSYRLGQDLNPKHQVTLLLCLGRKLRTCERRRKPTTRLGRGVSPNVVQLVILLAYKHEDRVANCEYGFRQYLQHTPPLALQASMHPIIIV